MKRNKKKKRRKEPNDDITIDEANAVTKAVATKEYRLDELLGLDTPRIIRPQESASRSQLLQDFMVELKEIYPERTQADLYQTALRCELWLELLDKERNK